MLYGSDSRLTADGDLLIELRHFSVSELARQMVITACALNMPHAGYVGEGSLADFVILDGMARSQVRLVVRGGHPWVGDADLVKQFGTKTVAALVDSVEKRIDAGLARRIQACSLQEPGLQIDAPYIQRWFFRR